MSETPFAGWYVLELMGHRRLTGYVEEVEIAGGKLLRIDIYRGDAEQPTLTQYYGVQSVYCMTPTTEALARAAALGVPRPVARYELEAPQPSHSHEDSFEDEEDDL